MATLVALPEGPRATLSANTARLIQRCLPNAAVQATTDGRFRSGLAKPTEPPLASENACEVLAAALASGAPAPFRVDVARAVLSDPHAELEIFARTGRHFKLSQAGQTTVRELARLRLDLPYSRFSAFPVHAQLAFASAFRDLGKEGIFSIRSREDVWGETYLRLGEQLADAAAEQRPARPEDWESKTGTDRLLALVELGITARAVRLITDPQIQLRLFDIWNASYPGPRRSLRFPTWLKFALDMLSYVLFLASFTVVLHQKTNFYAPYPIREFVLAAFVLGFFASEAQQLRNVGWRGYVGDTWNWADIVILLVFLIGGTMRLLAAWSSSDALEQAAWVVLSFNAVPLWVRPLHAAMMSNRLGFILTVLGKLFRDFATYLLVIICVTIGFSQVLDALVSPPDETLLPSLRYLLTNVAPTFIHAFLGAFDFNELPDNGGPSAFVGPLVMTVFMATSNILLLNLLIASFSSTYKSHAGNAKYERCLSFARLVTAHAGTGRNLPPPLNVLELPISFIFCSKPAEATVLAAEAEGRAWRRESLAARPPEPMELGATQGPGGGAPVGKAGVLNRVVADASADVSDALRQARKQRLAGPAGPLSAVEVSLENALKRLAAAQKLLADSVAAGA